VEMCGFAGAVDAHNPHLIPTLHSRTPVGYAL
jgi:hypothetical protein